MPLSTPTKREHLHTRVVTCKGFIREDGLMDIEGQLVDTKPFDIPNKDRGGQIKAGEALHGMSVRITLDENLQIHDAEAVMDHTPYNYCKSITPVFKKLIGIRIGPGWRKEILKVMGGINGCTHLTELLGPMATTAVQTRVTLKGDSETKGSGTKNKAPLFINTCHSHADDSPVVEEHWPDAFRKKNDS